MKKLLLISFLLLANYYFVDWSIYTRYNGLALIKNLEKKNVQQSM